MSNYISIVEELLEVEGLLLSVFPELSVAVAEFQAGVAEGCVSCAKKKKATKIVNKLAILDWGARDLSKLPDNAWLRQLARRKLGSSKRPIAADELPLEGRASCLDCVGKHLSQALVLMDEISQGYPEHIGLAIGRLRSAVQDIPTRRRKLRRTVTQALSELEGAWKSPDATDHLVSAKNYLKESLNDIGSSIAFWRVVGHMGEAADECFEESPELAAEIREARLELMDNKSFKPPLALFINRTRKLIKKERSDA